jgi:acyl-coenzyme A thioesterase PaaI-like protein
MQIVEVSSEKVAFASAFRFDATGIILGGVLFSLLDSETLLFASVQQLA